MLKLCTVESLSADYKSLIHNSLKYNRAVRVSIIEQNLRDLHPGLTINKTLMKEVADLAKDDTIEKRSIKSDFVSDRDVKLVQYRYRKRKLNKEDKCTKSQNTQSTTMDVQ